MKLYFSPGACSLASHIVLKEIGVPFEAVQVDLRTKKTKAGADYAAINPKGYVPAIELADGSLLTEGTAVLQYLADQKPASGLAPPPASFERYRLQEWLGYINSEIHKSFGPLFNPASSDATKDAAKANITKRLPLVVAALNGKDYLMGQFTVADAYLYTVLSWAPKMGVDLSGFPAITAYLARIDARPSVQAARAAEKPA
jgi:glutathione S-transferase